ncbi:MAG: hypothetical protein KDA84_23800 [Planctomycetaceae bacterium]|nr:hypothetical protein [Planctomycetaceae bacterium]
MCGIAGNVPLRNQLVDHGVIESLGQMLCHRMPDAQRVFVDRNVALQQRQISIRDSRTVAKQPLLKEKGSIFEVSNTEFQDGRDCARELKSRGHQIATNGDTEVIVHPWEEGGRDWVQRFWGMFALASVFPTNHRSSDGTESICNRPSGGACFFIGSRDIN